MAQLKNLLVTGATRFISNIFCNESITAPTFIGKLQGNADSASKATGVVNYGSTGRTIQIGYGGDGISNDAIKYIAGYTTGNGSDVDAKIKDVSKDALKAWLGLGSLAYSSESIPSVGNGTVTITQNGTNKGSFTLNQSGNATIALADTNTTYPDATQSAHGLMTAADKKKLDGIASGATAVSDLTVSGWGYKKTDTDTWRPLGTTAGTACAGNDSRLSNSRPASDVYAWAKAATKPAYSYSEILEAPAIYSGTSVPSASLGKNGDIYIKLV